MSSKLPVVAGKQLTRALEKRGWKVERVGGSHHVLEHPDFAKSSRCASERRGRVMGQWRRAVRFFPSLSQDSFEPRSRRESGSMLLPMSNR